MAESWITLPPDSTGKKLYTKQHVVGVQTVQAQVFNLADATLITNQQQVDYRGAASVRFSEGSPICDGFGGLKISQHKAIGLYDFVIDEALDLFSDTVVGSGSITRISSAKTMSLSVGSAMGDFAGRVSDKYHYYIPGTSNLVIMTVALSDSFHAGTERRWGLFDTNDGIYFDLDDTGSLNVSLRSSVSGAVVKTHIQRSNWNGDTLDGLGRSGFTLDLTKLNIYWVDFQWLGGGRVRFGIFDDYGNRIVAHTLLNANHNLYPYMRTGSLPIAINIENKAITAGASSIRLTCSAVLTEGELEYVYWRYGYDFPQKTITTNTLIGAIKSANTFNGSHNGVGAYPETFSCYVNTGVVKLDVYWDYLTLTSPNWIMNNGSTVIGTSNGTITLTGFEYKATSIYLDPGAHTIELSKYFEINDLGLTARADESTPQNVAIVATAISGTPTVEGTLGYRELR